MSGQVSSPHLLCDLMSVQFPVVLLTALKVRGHWNLHKTLVAGQTDSNVALHRFFVFRDQRGQSVNQLAKSEHFVWGLLENERNL